MSRMDLVLSTGSSRPSGKVGTSLQATCPLEAFDMWIFRTQKSTFSLTLFSVLMTIFCWSISDLTTRQNNGPSKLSNSYNNVHVPVERA